MCVTHSYKAQSACGCSAGSNRKHRYVISIVQLHCSLQPRYLPVTLTAPPYNPLPPVASTCRLPRRLISYLAQFLQVSTFSRLQVGCHNGRHLLVFVSVGRGAEGKVKLEQRPCLRAIIRFTGEKYCLRLAVVVSVISCTEGCIAVSRQVKGLAVFPVR